MSLDELHPGWVNFLGDLFFELLISLALVLIVQGRDLENIARDHFGVRAEVGVQDSTDWRKEPWNA